MFCDGFRDCYGGEDEENCPGENAVCPEDKFTCPNRKSGPLCIDISQLCNNKKDCHDGTDELPENCRLIKNMTES